MAQDIKDMWHVELRVLEVLRTNFDKPGLTYSELRTKCGASWRRAVSQIKKLKTKEAQTVDVKNIVYDMWSKGMVFIEPPRGRFQIPRVLDLDAGKANFPKVFGSLSDSSGATEESIPIDDRSAEKMLQDAYDDVAKDYIGGAAPIFKVRAKLKWPKKKFDDLIKDLNVRDDPIIELHGGDPKSYAEKQKADSIELRGRLYLLMRWRIRL